jgi:hypothetical protein
MPTRRPAPLLLAFWLAAVVVATAVGVLAVRLVAAQVGGPSVPVLSGNDVRSALTASPRPTRIASPHPSASAAPSQGPPPQSQSALKAFTSQGGTVGVRCRGRVAVKIYATPAQGYNLDETSEDAEVLEVRFASGRTRVRLGISCGSGTPVLVENRVDTSGGG